MDIDMRTSITPDEKMAACCVLHNIMYLREKYGYGFQDKLTDWWVQWNWNRENLLEIETHQQLFEVTTHKYDKNV